ncbi:MAG: hypothetical protein ACOX4O_05200 [Eubacteriales bacterium]|jgi:hypothetical protein
MKNKYKLPALLLISVLLPTLLISAASCGFGRNAEARKAAEEYLAGLQSIVGEDDPLELTDDRLDPLSDIEVFRAYSGKYDEHFNLYVYKDGKVLDTYYAAALKESAAAEFGETAEAVLGDALASYDFRLKNLLSSDVSGRVFASIHEAHAACGSGLIDASVMSAAEGGFSEQQLSALLLALQNKGLYGALRVNGDEREFNIAEDKISYYAPDGADGGAYMREFDYRAGE